MPLCSAAGRGSAAAAIRADSCHACLPTSAHSAPLPACPCLQLMHVLVAAAMWQLHLGASADYRTVNALLDGTAQCPV